MAGAVRPFLCGARRRPRPVFRDDGRPPDPGRPSPSQAVAASGADPVDRRRVDGLADHGAAVRLCRSLRRPRRCRHRIEHPAPTRLDTRHRQLRHGGATSTRHLQLFRRSRESRVAGARRGAAADPCLATGAGPDGGAGNRSGGRAGVTGTGGSRHQERRGSGGGWPWPPRLRHPDHDRRARYGEPHGLSAVPALPHP